MARATNQRRRDSIVRLVRKTGFVRTSELSGRFGVSTVTIRQDIDALSAEGLRPAHLWRRGFADRAEPRTPPSTSASAAQQRREESASARAAAQSIRPGETVLLDSGTTTIEIARHLPENADITVVTPALNIALEAGSRSGVEVLGLRRTAQSANAVDDGHEIARSFSEIFADRLFLATYGVDVDKGLAERSLEVAETKRALIAPRAKSPWFAIPASLAPPGRS